MNKTQQHIYNKFKEDLSNQDNFKKLPKPLKRMPLDLSMGMNF